MIKSNAAAINGAKKKGISGTGSGGFWFTVRISDFWSWIAPDWSRAST